MIAAVFAMQGAGQFLASLVALIATAAFKDKIDYEEHIRACNGNAYAAQVIQCTANPEALTAVDRLWRIIIGVGIIPALIALYFRLTIPETPRYTMDVTREVEQATADTFAWMQGRFEGLTKRPCKD